MSGESVAGRRAGEPRYHTVVLLLCAAVFISYIDRTNISVAAIAMKDELGWTETDKGTVLSSFYVGYLLMMAASGALANRYGGWLVLGIAVLWWSAWTILTPAAATMSLAALVAARIGLGLGEAAVFPSSINMIGRWVPPEHRSRATALLVSALSLGTLFSLPVTGWMVRAHGWQLPFFVFGAVGLVWFVAWFALVGEHRAAAPAHAVESAQPAPPAAPGQAARRHIPWGRLLALPAVWAIIVAHFACNWSLYLTLAWMPSYFKSTFGVSLADAGLLSAAPWLVSFVTANLVGAWADRMLKAGRKAGFVRKLLQGVSLVGGGLVWLLLPHATTAAAGVTLMCFATCTGAFAMSGFAPNCFDIAPRYADVVWGISNSVATLPGIIAVFITGWLVDRTGNFAAPFTLTAAILLGSAVVYQLFGSGERLVE